MAELYCQKYMGFGPTLTAEKLSESDGINLSDETVRKWLIEVGYWQKKCKHKTHRQWSYTLTSTPHTNPQRSQQ